MTDGEILLEARDLRRTYDRGRTRALDGVSLALRRGRTLGVLGESGSGKSTLARLLLCLEDPDSGQILYRGRPITRTATGRLGDFRRKVQVIFQEPLASLDPRLRVRESLEEPYRVAHGKPPDPGVLDELLRTVELPAGYLGRYPRQLSGGECQRVAIARAICLGPELVICDEPVSSLDALVRAQVLNLLLRLQRQTGMAYLFISHDLRVVRHVSDEVLVLKDGRVCEAGERDRVFDSPEHPYTRALLRLLDKPKP